MKQRVLFMIVLLLLNFSYLNSGDCQPVKRTLPSGTNTVQSDEPPPPPVDPTEVVPIPGVVWLIVAGLGFGVKRLYISKSGLKNLENVKIL